MTITRLWQAGAEFNEELVEFTSVSNSVFTVSSTKARTGTYAFQTRDNYYGIQVLDSATNQFRLSMFVNHNGTDAGDTPTLVRILSGATNVIEVKWAGDTSTLQLLVAGTLQDSVVSATFANTDTWLHIGIDCKIDGTGWATVYLDGIEILAFSGATNGAATSVNTLWFGGVTVNQNWGNHLYYDDLYIDDTAGESAAAVVPDYRFVPLVPTGNGFHDDWVGNDADSTDNYLLVDETPPDGDTTYVESATASEEDSYAMTDLTLETGYEVSAVIGMAYAKKLNSGGALDLRITMRTQVSGSPVTGSGSAFALGTDYALYWRRDAVRPDAGAWDEATVNDLEIGVLAE